MVDLLIIFAELTIILSYLLTNIIFLRSLAIIGMFFYVMAGFAAGWNNEGMKALIFFSAIAIVVNAYQLIKILRDTSSIFVPKNVEDIYLQVFKSMTTTEFKQLYKHAVQISYPQNTYVIKENETRSSIELVLSGALEVQKNEKTLATIEKGCFIGEMSYLTDAPTNANVYAITENVTCLAWTHEALKKLQKEYPEIYNHFFQIISVDLVRKITMQNKNFLP